MAGLSDMSVVRSLCAPVRVLGLLLVVLTLSRILLMACSGVAIFTTIGIVLSVLFESLRFFESVPIVDFMFGTNWSPQTAIREDQVGSSGSFGAVPLFLGIS